MCHRIRAPRRVSRARVALLALAALAVVPFVGGAPSQAEVSNGQCPGTRIEHLKIKDGKYVLGYLNVYWDAASGRNCVRTDSNTQSGCVSSTECHVYTYGRSKWMYVALWVDGGSSDYDADLYYRYYAGRVLLHASNTCIKAKGQIGYESSTRSYNGTVNMPWSHCD